jgi:ABC-2 type transport system permease protein
MSVEAQVKAEAKEGVTPGELSQLIAEAPAVHRGGSRAAMVAIMQRELSSLFFSPIAYFVGTSFLLAVAVAFGVQTLVPGNEASMRATLEWVVWASVLLLPLLTMRSLAEEYSTGAIETLMTAPVSDTAVVLGKFLGTYIFYLLLVAATLLHLFLMAYYADPVAGVVIASYLGMVLVGAFFISVGVFASSCTRHQLLAAMLAIMILALFTFAAYYGTMYLWVVKGLDLKEVCKYVDVSTHFSDFAKGSLDLASVVFFLSGTGLFLFLAVKVLESRRWR